MAYIHFTQEQKEQARHADIAAMLMSRGETVKRAGSEFEWLDGGAKVTIRGNLWYHQYEQKGGDAIEFVKRFMDKTYPEAVEYLLGGSVGTIVPSSYEPKKKEPVELEMPEKNENSRRAFAYLHFRRGIDKDVLNTFFRKGLIYESAQYHNAVFVGYDGNGNPKHANLRGTGMKSTFKGNAPGSLPQYSFHYHGTGDKLYLFEASIDMLSFISIHKENWQQYSYAACCGVGDSVLSQMLGDNPNIKTVCLCLDNDEKGQQANKRIADKLHIKEIPTEILVPDHKDWNEDLLFMQKGEPKQAENKEEETCRALQLS